MGFTETLKRVMQEKGLSQSELSRLTNIPTSLMSEYCTGKKSPALSNAIALADALNLTLDELVGRDELEAKKSPDEMSEEEWDSEITSLFLAMSSEERERAKTLIRTAFPKIAEQETLGFPSSLDLTEPKKK